MLSAAATAALRKVEDTSLQVISHHSRLIHTIPMDQADAEHQRAGDTRADGVQFQWGVVITENMIAFRLRLWVKAENVVAEVDVALNWEIGTGQSVTDREVKALMVEYGAAATHGAALAVLHTDLQLLATNTLIRFSIEDQLISQVDENFDGRVVRGELDSE